MGTILSLFHEAEIQPHSQPDPESNNKPRPKPRRKRKPKPKRHLNILRIALEVRELIYQHLFTSTAINPYLRGCCIGRPNRQRTNTAILLVCRQTYLEARPLLFKYGLFHFTTPLCSNVYARSSFIPLEHNTHIDGSRMSTRDLCLVQRIHGSYNLLHCLNLARNPDLRDTMTKNVFPGLRVAELALKELTIEVTIVEHVALDTRQRHVVTTRVHRRRLAVADREKISVVRKLQAMDLPFRLFLLVYYASRPRAWDELARTGLADWVKQYPSFVVGPQGMISNDEGQLTSEDVDFRLCVLDAIKMYDVDDEDEDEVENGSEASSAGI